VTASGMTSEGGDRGVSRGLRQLSGDSGETSQPLCPFLRTLYIWIRYSAVYTKYIYIYTHASHLLLIINVCVETHLIASNLQQRLICNSLGGEARKVYGHISSTE
jgi:hypothetical protein